MLCGLIDRIVTMRSKLQFVLVLLLVLGTWATVSIAAQHTITCRTNAINKISINGSQNSLSIVVGDSLQEGEFNWAITTNEANKRIVGSLDVDMPLGTSLHVELKAPTGSISKGFITLSTTPQDLVVGIGGIAESNLGGRYVLVGNIDMELQMTITFTLADWR